MTIELTPELGIPLGEEVDFLNLRARAEAMFNSIQLLEQHGLNTKPTVEDKEAAAKLTTAYAQDPVRTSKLVNNARSAAITPAALKAIRSYLDEYGQAVVSQAIEVRNLVTNRLLEESQNPDPRIRIRALELLGKHSDVGLFTEKQEVTVTHQTTDELKLRLKQKLQRLVKKDDEPEDAVVLNGEIVNLDEELGLSDAPAVQKPDVFEPEAE